MTSHIITNLKNNRKYIGKKLARFKKSRPPLKGKVNKRRYTVESDWQTYYGSNDELTIDVETLGTENFKREIHSKYPRYYSFTNATSMSVVTSSTQILFINLVELINTIILNQNPDIAS